MKKLRIDWKKYRYFFVIFIFVFLFTKTLFGKDILFEIQGNNFTDDEVILSLLENIPEKLDDEFSDAIIKTLNESNLFADVSVKLLENKYLIIVEEYQIINKITFINNERIDDDELEIIALDTELDIYNSKSIDLFIKEVKKVYESFGYNNVKINYYDKKFEKTNTVDLYFEINEGKITKINQIFFSGNQNIDNQDLKEIIVSKTRSIRNVFANNNYKPFTIERDKILLLNYYKNKGFLDIKVDTQIEYLNTNRVNLYFNIDEGSIYSLSSISINDKSQILKQTTLQLLNEEINTYLIDNKIFSIEDLQQLENKISSIIIDNDIEFFEINTLDNIKNRKIDIIFDVSPISPKYTKQINIVGNYRTYDYVIRRELDIIEGDSIYKNQIIQIQKKLKSLNLFESVLVREELLDNNNINLIIEVEEKQTGSFNAGVSVGTLDGFAIVTGLREKNFYGTGRSLDALINTSNDRNQFKLITTDRLSYENDADISYSINYKQEDFSKASSYKLDTFTSGIGISYNINKKISHDIDIDYVLKDYSITNSSTVLNSILNSSGENISFLLKNNIRYSTLNPGFLSKSGNFFNFNNTIETPTSSNNGFIRNIITLKQYYNQKNNIISAQTRFGNIFSLNNNDILTDDKFSLGGRWLRGFDSYGAGPRNSRTSYVGANNIAAAKFDYSYEITNNSNFPIYLNIFNDYGLLWDNKTKPTHSDNKLRSSAGFGIRYYSPVGPIGFTWGFPLIDEEYDIKRMFLFSIGNID